MGFINIKINILFPKLENLKTEDKGIIKIKYPWRFQYNIFKVFFLIFGDFLYLIIKVLNFVIFKNISKFQKKSENNPRCR